MEYPVLDFSESDALDADDVVERWVSVGVALLATVCAGFAGIIGLDRGASALVMIVAALTVVSATVLAVSILIILIRRSRQDSRQDMSRPEATGPAS